MLWSLLKVVLFFALVGALALGAEWLLEAEGTLRIAVAGFEVTLGPLQMAIAAVLLVAAVWLALKLLGFLVALVRFLNGDETAVTRYFSRNREKKGLNALSDALLALASGEGREAQTRAEKAERYLDRPDLTRLIVAQGAELTGDRTKAADVYKQLLKDDRTRFVGVRGLMKQKLEDGDTDTALALAQKAFALKPRHVETQDTLLRLQAARQDWSGARQTLGAKLKSGALPRDVHKRRDAVLALGEAKGIVDEGASIQARESAIEANRLSPDLVPAAVMAARHYIDNRQERYATRVIKKAWTAQPHPDLAAAFAAISPEESPTQRIRRFNTLTRIHPDHPETRMLLAELNIAAEDFPAARRALGDLATENPTSRSVTIMAAIERGEGADEAVVRGWLTRALSVPRGPQWVCENCHGVHGDWAPICGNCGAFDTLTWTEPREGVVAMPTQTAMLPLIVGQIDAPKPEVPETDPAETAPAADETATPAQPEATAPTTAPATPAPAPAPEQPAPTVPPVSEDDRSIPTTVPEAEVIVPQEQRDEENARKGAN
ncbi:heme biosynthesis protein HemY [Palleronia sediminis]|uniref:Heme biosynthesis protein HemY n=1 Tax=Palleronia sediminis TaxID=2547833 RepID=A0A4R5ZYD2_9RHOB|nr:heme biosynthesis HemY N-terminal domain-containing protein [Palleronia sediminis]TDL75232.1 heme biosynthesis protein HemY [Palleronia sediminis]